MDTTPSKERLIEALQSFAEEVESVPTVREMRNEGPYSPHYYKEEFGSWHDALREAGIQPTHGITQDVDREELLENLRRVDEETDRPPRRRDAEEHGEYPYNLYEEEFRSFIHALEEAGIEPDEKQYRFSSVETPAEKKGSANVEKLRNNGPTPSTELANGISPKDRQHGVWKFTLDSGTPKAADSIYYLDGEHTPELVLRRFFQQNPKVLKYREPHGLKIEIREYKSSWGEIGREIVDELVEKGTVLTERLENLAIIRVYKEESLEYCFASSIESEVQTDDLPIKAVDHRSSCPVWGFSRDEEDIWRTLSEQDGLLFSTRPGVFTHYVPINERLEDNEVMKELWLEYEDGVRTGGIEKPWPYIILGKNIHEIRVDETNFAEEIDADLNESPIQLLDEEALESFLNSYGGIDSYLRNRTTSSDPGHDEVKPDSNASTREVVDYLLNLSGDELPADGNSPGLEKIERKKRDAAFRDGIYSIYSGCAICGEQFESPDGTLDLEAAHILPKSQDGPDVLQNGLALCSRHHWALDNGWFEIDSDYEIHVREYPRLNGYDELRQYDGEYLQVPTEEELQPHPQYLQQRNQMHGQ